MNAGNPNQNPGLIEIPHNFSYREYQKLVRNFLRNGGKRAIICWHRRAGKDKTMFNILVEFALRKKGGYVYVFETYSQGKKVIWDSIDSDGKKFIDHIPERLIAKKNEQEMKITLANGSFIQILGSENINSLRGISPAGIVFSEYAFQNPMAWQVLAPILAQNDGWALFNSTPNGENHFFRLLETAKLSSDWFTQVLTIDDTHVVSQEYIDSQRAEGMPEEMIKQEYYCSFGVGAVGSYYSKYIQDLKEKGQICNVPYEQSLGVYTFWDLGINDKMSIWFVQFFGKEIRVIDFYEDDGRDLGYYIDFCLRKPYRYEKHYLPHDGDTREMQTGITRRQYFYNAGIMNVEIVPMTDKNLGIDAVRRLLPLCYFDETRCKQGLACLSFYHKEYDQKNQTYKNTPKHDWSSNAADAFRYLAVSHLNLTQKPYTGGSITIDTSILG